jgi:hypothetical protein
MTIDTGRASRRRHPVHGLIEVDVTRARMALHAHQASTGERLSFTAFVVANIARAVAIDRNVHAYRDLRGRLVAFTDVDIALSVETQVQGQPFPLTHVIRRADRRSTPDIHREIRQVQHDPTSSPSWRLARMARGYLLLPALVRHRLLGLMHRFPHRQRAVAGTVGVTAVGMFGTGGGWGIAFQVHTLNIVIGGITRRPALYEHRVVERDYLHLTISVDHDVVDGAPAARFVARLRDLLEAANGLTDLTADERGACPAPSSRAVPSRQERRDVIAVGLP